jgi:hypothetical protein
MIPFDATTKVANYKLRNFCSSSCAAKVNNRRAHSEESRLKASKTALFNHYIDNFELRDARFMAKSLNATVKSPVKNAGKYYVDGLVYGQDYITCPYCDLRFSIIQSSHLKLHGKTLEDLRAEFGADYKTISNVAHVKKVNASKEVQQKLIATGVHKGWALRNKPSFA